MNRRIHLGPLLDDLSAGVDKEGVAHGDGHLAEVAERAVLIDDLVRRVSEQAEGQAFLGAELLVAIGRVDADAEDDGVVGVILGLVALEVVRLDGAALGHVLGVEVEHDPLAVEAVERDLRAILRGEGEGWRGLAHCGHGLVVGRSDGQESGSDHNNDRRDKNSGDGKKEGFSHVDLRWLDGSGQKADAENERRSPDGLLQGLLIVFASSLRDSTCSVRLSFPTLKRGANKPCAYGAYLPL